MNEKKTTDVGSFSSNKFMHEMDVLLKRADKAVELGQNFYNQLNEAREDSEGIIERLNSTQMKEVEDGVKQVLDECMNYPTQNFPYMGNVSSNHQTSKFESADKTKRHRIKI